MPKDGAWWLSELPWSKVRIKCDCGLVRQYDRRGLLAKAGDWSMPSLMEELARREGCTIGINGTVYNRCRVRFDHSADEMAFLMGNPSPWRRT